MKESVLPLSLGLELYAFFNVQSAYNPKPVHEFPSHFVAMFSKRM
jgi:hypothetical protein